MGDEVTCVNCGDRECVCQADRQAGGSLSASLDSGAMLEFVKSMTDAQRQAFITCAPPMQGGSTAITITRHSQPTWGAPQGWECPRCQSVNAPHVSRCSCQPNFASPWQPPAQPYPYEPYGGIQCTGIA